MGHFYLPNGKPFYEVVGRDGVLRDVTLRDARKVNAVPGFSAFDQFLAKPHLDEWKIDQAIMAALTIPRRSGESDQAFIERIRYDAKAQAKAAADEGTRIHDAIEMAMRQRPFPREYEPHVAATLQEIMRLFPDVKDWVPEMTFAHPNGHGGKIDIHSPSTGITGDFKGKDGTLDECYADGKPKPLAYSNHVEQLASYQFGARLKSAPCFNIFISRTHPGVVKSHVWEANEVKDAYEDFLSVVRCWQQRKRYWPTW